MRDREAPSGTRTVTGTPAKAGTVRSWDASAVTAGSVLEVTVAVRTNRASSSPTLGRETAVLLPLRVRASAFPLTRSSVQATEALAVPYSSLEAGRDTVLPDTAPNGRVTASGDALPFRMRAKHRFSAT